MTNEIYELLFNYVMEAEGNEYYIFRQDNILHVGLRRYINKEFYSSEKAFTPLDPNDYIILSLKETIKELNEIAEAGIEG